MSYASAITCIAESMNRLFDRLAKAEAMLEALDDYWALHPEAETDPDGDCPFCENPNREDWEHEYCLEGSWNRFQRLRKEFEEGKP
jgi:hypothetical protein